MNAVLPALFENGEKNDRKKATSAVRQRRRQRDRQKRPQRGRFVGLAPRRSDGRAERNQPTCHQEEVGGAEERFEADLDAENLVPDEVAAGGDSEHAERREGESVPAGHRVVPWAS